MIRPPPRSTRTDTLLPYTTRFRSPIPNIFDTLSINLGTSYVNDFNAFGRIYQVRAQADQQLRMEREDIQRLKVRSATGALVPLRSEEHTSELQSLMRISYAVFCLKKKTNQH